MERHVAQCPIRQQAAAQNLQVPECKVCKLWQALHRTRQGGMLPVGNLPGGTPRFGASPNESADAVRQKLDPAAVKSMLLQHVRSCQNEQCPTCNKLRERIKASREQQQLDKELEPFLGNGTIVLLDSTWLISVGSDRHLDYDTHTGRVLLKRRQDLPLEAFLSAEQSVALLKRNDRSILVLTYGWLTADHPDPHGTTLAEVRRYVQEQASGQLGIFWDFASLFQKERTHDQQAAFKSALTIMSHFYASPYGTVVLQHKEIVAPNDCSDRDVYSTRPYDQRGWCIFEEALATYTTTVIEEISKMRAVKESQMVRPKMVSITGGASIPCTFEGRDPSHVLEEASERLQSATFTGAGDREAVIRGLMDYRKKIDSGVRQSDVNDPVNDLRP